VPASSISEPLILEFTAPLPGGTRKLTHHRADLVFHVMGRKTLRLSVPVNCETANETYALTEP
jgi:hypothetical protein